MRRIASGIVVALAIMCGIAFAATNAPQKHVSAAQTQAIARGRYLVAFGCNDCHTPGWRETDGHVPVKAWMIGTPTGFRGPWGTVYPANVRLRFQQISEQQWLDMVRTRGGHPPMVWTDLRSLTRQDIRAIYTFVHGLGPAGSAAPTSVSPEREPSTPYFNLVTPGPNAR